MKLTAAVAASLVVVAGAAAAGPTVKLTAAGTGAAKQSLIALSDLGKAWTAKASPQGGLQLACKGWQPSLKGIVETGAATSPAFSSSSVGPFLSQISSTYATSAQAKAVWSRAIRPGLVACVAQSVLAIAATGQGVKVKITSKGPLQVQKSTALETAYRVVATLASPKVSYTRKLYFDVVLVARKSTISELTFSSFLAPVPAKVEAALGALVAHRIGLPTA